MLKSKANWRFSTAKLEGDVIDSLLEARGIVSLEEKQQFLHPSLEDLTAPGHFHNIEKAKQRIDEAIAAGESILIYGDYDADGITSTALLMNVFIDLGANVTYYIPNRFTDGYGLNEKKINEFHDQGITLIITVDTGIANNSEAALAKSLGIDLIITDHHEVQLEEPDAFAIIHPKLSPAYSFKSLAGVGVAFQLAHYLLDELPIHLIELAAIGTIADMVPLHNDNRIIAYFGLKALNNTSNVGLRALIAVANMDNRQIITERDVGFSIAPRLNAVGRLQDANIAVELLLTLDSEEARTIAAQIEQCNTKRKKIVQDIVVKAENSVHPDDKIIMLYDEHWHEGVLGIAASRLVRKYQRPVIMLAYNKSTNELKGSGRSIPAFHLFDQGMQMKHLFTQFGGHSQAAGMTFSFDHFEEIKAIFQQALTDQLTEDDFKQVIESVHSISHADMTENFVQRIQMLAPFGVGNEEPVFHYEGVPSLIRQLGQHQQHLKMQFKENNQFVDVIGFQFGKLFYFISQNTPVSVVGKLQINEWNGNKTVQMQLEDIAVEGWQLFDFRSRKQIKNFSAYFQNSMKQLMIGRHKDEMETVTEGWTIPIRTFEDDLSTFTNIELLYICDLPDNLERLKQIIRHIKPLSIHISYGITEDAFLQSLPTRDEFKWVYGFIVKYGTLQLKVDLEKMMKMKGWKKEKVLFILKVFLDLQFIYVKEDMIYVQENSEKRELHESETYKKRVEQSEIEQTLYYSTYEDLKQWFLEQIDRKEDHKEEIAHGL